MRPVIHQTNLHINITEDTYLQNNRINNFDSIDAFWNYQQNILYGCFNYLRPRWSFSNPLILVGIPVVSRENPILMMMMIRHFLWWSTDRSTEISIHKPFLLLNPLKINMIQFHKTMEKKNLVLFSAVWHTTKTAIAKIESYE